VVSVQDGPNATQSCSLQLSELRKQVRLAMGRKLGKHEVTGQMGTCFRRGFIKLKKAGRNSHDRSKYQMQKAGEGCSGLYG
jgi:hypothetical protein